MSSPGSADSRPRVSPEQYRANLVEVVKLARGAGAHILFVRFAPQRADQADYIAALQAVASELNVPVVTYDGPRVDLVHPTVAGYHTIAGQIADALAAEGFLDATDEEHGRDGQRAEGRH